MTPRSRRFASPLLSALKAGAAMVLLVGALSGSSPPAAWAQLAVADVIWDARLSPVAAAVSPDGVNVYVAGWEDDAVTSFERNPATGELLFVDAEYDGVDGVEGLNQPISVAVSPNGENVYVAGRRDNAVAVFARDGPTGGLAFTQAVVQGIGGVSGLTSPMELTVSPDGSHVYVAASGLVALSADPLTGELDFIEAELDDGPFAALALAPSGNHLYAAMTGFLTDQAGVALFERNPSTGELGLLAVYSSDLLQVIERVSSISVSPDGAHVIVTGSEESALVVLLADQQTGALTFLEAHIDGVDGVQGLGGASTIRMSPDGSNAYVKGTLTAGEPGEPAVAVFSRQAASGKLTFVEAETQAIRGVQSAPGAVAVSPDGHHLYVASDRNDYSDLLTVLAREPASGALEFVQSATGPGEAHGLDMPESIGVSPDGRHLYVAGYREDALVALHRDLATGDLTFIEADQAGSACSGCLERPVAVSISPDGRYVYVSSEGGNAISVFARDPASGAVEFVEAKTPPTGLAFPGHQVLSRDGKFMYVTVLSLQFFKSGIAVFSRDETSGSVGFLEAVIDDTNGVDGLGSVQEIALSPDGANLYAASFSDHAVSVFSRDPQTGRLIFIEAYFDGVRGVDELRGAWSVAVSEDGQSVYAAASIDSAITVFAREAPRGRLSFVEALVDGIGGIDGLEGAQSVGISADGLRVYAGSVRDSAVTVFRRAPDRGKLTLLAAYFDGAAGIDGIGGPTSVTLPDDGKHLLIAGRFDDAVASFLRLEPLFEDGFESGGTKRWSGSVP